MKIEIKNGKGIIRLRHRDEFNQQVFYINKDAIALDVHDGGGTMGRYFFLSENSNRNIIIEDINRAMNNGEVSDLNEISDILPSLLELFENGLYKISLGDFWRMFQRYVLMHIDFDLYYPPESLICFTQSEAAINNARVEYYKRMIESGKRPIVILTDAQYSEGNQLVETHFFIVDGHHKILAYNQLQIDPRVLSITRQLGGLNEIDLEYFDQDEKTFNQLYDLSKKKASYGDSL
ncbi:MAG TPA: hypothetical protein PLW44_14410 [Chitinophagales bacterium]|nr:hypothetical protein [Chitinophagales bacterium]